jgi:MscS family membrane protein
MDSLKTITGEGMAYHLLVGAIILVLSVLLSRAVKSVLGFIGRRFITQTKTDLDDRILDVILKRVRAFTILFGAHLAVSDVRKGCLPDDTTILQICDYADGIIYIAVVLIVVKVILGIARVSVDWYLEQKSAGGSAQLKLTLGPLTSKTANVIVGLIAIIVILDHFGVNIGSLLVSLGVGSLAVALAAQDTLANMIAGFVILVDRPFRVGDRIELAAGVIGDVQEIGLRSTKVLNFDNNVIVIPNAELVKSRIVNFAYPGMATRLQLKVSVAYGTDPERVRRILLGLADAQPNVLKDPPPEVFFTAMGDSAIEFTLFARATDFLQRFRAESTLRELAYAAFLKEGIEIPFPQRVVHMKTSS